MIKELAISLSLLTTPVGYDDLTQGERDEYLRVQNECLAMNVYHEARSQGTAGRMPRWTAVVALALPRSVQWALTLQVVLQQWKLAACARSRSDHQH